MCACRCDNKRVSLAITDARTYPIESVKRTQLTSVWVAIAVFLGAGCGPLEENPEDEHAAELAESMLIGVPRAPGGLTLTAVSSTQIDLTWMDRSSNEKGFKIARREISHRSGKPLRT